MTTGQNLWFTEGSGGKIGKISPTGSITEFPLSLIPPLGFTSITAGSNGRLWFTGVSDNAIGEEISIVGNITTSGTIEEFPVDELAGSASSFRGLNGITQGPDGNMWIAWWPGTFIVNMTPTGKISLMRGINGYAGAVTLAPDNNVWFTEYNFGDGFVPVEAMIGRMTRDGAVKEFPVPTSQSYVTGIAAGSDGTMWFTESSSTDGAAIAGAIGKITPDGKVTEYPLPGERSRPGAIVKGPDGNMWFTEDLANKIGMISPNGLITEFSVSTAATGTAGIAVGADKNIWFTEPDANKIGVIKLDAPPPYNGGWLHEWQLVRSRAGWTRISA